MQECHELVMCVPRGGWWSDRSVWPLTGKATTKFNQASGVDDG